jgi:hypothetical protein
VCARDDWQQQQHAGCQEARPEANQAGRPSLARALAGDQGRAEHRQRQRRECQAGLQRVVLEDHLQVDREGDHRPAERDVLEHLRRDAEPEQIVREELWIEQRGLALALAPDEPARE